MAGIAVSEETPWVSYTASGGQTSFAYTWPVYDDSHLAVYQNGTLLTLTTHYTVTGVESESGGNVVLVSGATADDAIVIAGVIPLERTSQYDVDRPFGQGQLDEDLDRIALMLNRLKLMTMRSPQRSLDDWPGTQMTLPDPDEDKVLGWDEATGQLINVDPGTVGEAGDAFNAAIPGEGRTVTTLQAYLANNAVYNVMDYGAAGTGLVDDRAAILAAITACPEHAMLFFPAGKTFRVDATLAIEKRISVSGHGATIKAGPALTDAVLQIGTTDVLAEFCKDTVWHGTIDGLIVDGNDVADGIDFVRTNRALFQNLIITKCKGRGMRFDRANESTWINCTVIDCYDPGDATPLVEFDFAHGSNADATNNCVFVGCSWVGNGNKVILNVQSPSDIANQFGVRKISFIGCLIHGVSSASSAGDPLRLPIHADLVLTKLGSCANINFWDCRWQLAASTGTAIQLGSSTEVDARTASGFQEAQNCFIYGGDILTQAVSGTAIDVQNVNGIAGHLACLMDADLTISDSAQVLAIPTSARFKAEHSGYTTSRTGFQVENVGASGVASSESPKIEIKNPNSMQVHQSVTESGAYRQYRMALSNGGSNAETLVFEDDETNTDVHLASATEALNIGKNTRGVRSVSLATLTAEPSDKHEGMMVMADRATWDPLGISTGGAYVVWYDGTIWRGHKARQGTAAPTANATFVGQIFIDTTAKAAYIATATGTGASDWERIE